jgi:hypothetical protein
VRCCEQVSEAGEYTEFVEMLVEHLSSISPARHVYKVMTIGLYLHNRMVVIGQSLSYSICQLPVPLRVSRTTTCVSRIETTTTELPILDQ